MDAARNGLTVTVVYDNRALDQGLQPAWGFACLVEGLKKTILFDTGGDGPTLLNNMAELGFAPRDVDAVVLSHAHGDHTGGLDAFLDANHEIAVYLLDSFRGDVEKDVRGRGGGVVAVRGRTQLCEGAVLMGEMVGDSGIPEQSLLLQGASGGAVITGCAHPGIVRIVERAKTAAPSEVLVAIGGFHLMRDSERSIRGIIAALEQIGVVWAMPCHCSGDLAIELFAKAYGDEFPPCGAGSRVDVGRWVGSPASGQRTPKQRRD